MIERGRIERQLDYLRCGERGNKLAGGNGVGDGWSEGREGRTVKASPKKEKKEEKKVKNEAIEAEIV